MNRVTAATFTSDARRAGSAAAVTVFVVFVVFTTSEASSAHYSREADRQRRAAIRRMKRSGRRESDKTTD